MKPNTTKNRPEVITGSQRVLAEQIFEVGTLHFRQSWRNEALKPRTTLLIAGPTGTGKSHSVRLAAKKLDAHYILASAGTWIPAGAEASLQATMPDIVECLRAHKRVLLHLDEIDKFFTESGDSWARSCRQDLFALLEGILTPNANRCKTAIRPPLPSMPPLPKRKPDRPGLPTGDRGSGRSSEPRLLIKDAQRRHSPEETLEQMAERLFIVGSGTWQESFEQGGNSIGFGEARPPTGINTHKLPNLGPEIRRRFKTPILFLDYPTPDENEELCRAFGLTALAKKAGVTFDPWGIDWSNVGGLSYLQSMKTDMECILQKQRKLLILDLDETLIHGDPDSYECDFVADGIPVMIRPGAIEFIENMEQTFEIGVWTSASRDYASAIVKRLFARPVKFLWTRERCVQRFNHETSETEFIKDLRKIRRRKYDLSRVLVVDDSPEKLARNYGNLVRVPPFTGEADDVLEKLSSFLQRLADEPDVRPIEKRGWLEQNSIKL